MSVVTDLKILLAGRDFRRLFFVRVASQFGDGAFQAGLATLVLFSPESQNSARALAGVFLVMLAPFTIIGPFAGVFLDRWSRRQVMFYGNILRVIITFACAFSVLTQGITATVYVLALINLSINRFILAAFASSLPRVVERDKLLVANSLLPTLGGISSGAGMITGVVTGLFFEPGRTKDASVLAIAALIFIVAAALVTRIPKNQLGPDGYVRTPLRQEIRRVTADLVAGVRHLAAERTPWHGLIVMAIQRWIYGAMFMSGILISRNLLSDPEDIGAGMALFGIFAAATAIGYGLAIVVTPTLSPRFGAQRWIVLCLLVGALGQLSITIWVTPATMIAAALILGVGAQSVKITVDTIVHQDTLDQFRGRAFSIYDVMYNAAFMLSATMLATVVPDTGYSIGVYAFLSATYLVSAIWFARQSRSDLAWRTTERLETATTDADALSQPQAQ